MNRKSTSRRNFLKYSGAGLTGLVAFSISPRITAQNKDLRLYVGTYTSGESVGIYRCAFDQRSGDIRITGETGGINNPSYLAITDSGEYLYSVNESDDYRDTGGGAVSAFAVDQATGDLTFINQQSSQGGWPCYIASTRSGNTVLAANYKDGTVAVFPTGSDGRLKEASDLEQHQGSGPNSRRQEGPHAHCIVLSPDEKFALSADLGADKIMIYQLRQRRNQLVPADQAFIRTEPGAGPRHLVFHPGGKHVFVINELNATITSYDYNQKSGELSEIQTVPALPSDFTMSNTSADIHISPDGRFVYASNRGHDSIVVYQINPADGNMTYVEHENRDISRPRNFVISPDGAFVLVANQDANSIVVFQRNANDGKLHHTGIMIDVPAPVCLKFV